MSKVIFLSLLLLLIPTLIVGDCTCESESESESEERDKSQALKYKIVAIASILVASAIGVSLPILGKIIPALHPDKNFFFLIKAFAAGVILATGFIHVLPDAFESLTSPCLKEHPWADFPFTGFVAMVSAIGTLMIDTVANSYYSQKSKRTLLNNNTIVSVSGDDEKNTTVDTGNHNHGSAGNHLHVHAHNHGPVSDASQLVRHRVISQVLELGIVVHSVIIGISLGASQSPKTIKPLVAVLTFHQFFEGMGLGGCITQVIFLSLLLLLIPTLIVGDCNCTCESESESEERDKSQAVKYKIAAIASILVASAIGVSLPILGKIIPALHPDKNFFFLIKAFAAGVILATGFIHVLPDAFQSLTSPCLKEHPWADFPFTGFVAMVSTIGTLMIDTCANSYYSQKSKRTLLNNNTNTIISVSVSGDEEKNTTVDTAANHLHVHAHNHGHVLDASQLVRHRVISQVLELGIVVHSVIIGISLGASQSPTTIKPLVAALTFHQFFEGMGLGGCITQAKFKTRGVVVMALFFSLTTPMGIGIGLGITNVYDENSTTALIVEGIFNAASAGILIYMALVDLLSADFMSPKLQNNGRLQLGANVSLLLGAGCMSLLAKWA